MTFSYSYVSRYFTQSTEIYVDFIIIHVYIVPLHHIYPTDMTLDEMDVYWNEAKTL